MILENCDVSHASVTLIAQVLQKCLISRNVEYKKYCDRKSDTVIF